MCFTKEFKKVKKIIKPRSLQSQSQSGSWELTPISSDHQLQLSPPDYGHKYDCEQDEHRKRFYHKGCTLNLA